MNQENFKLENQEYLKKSLFYLGFGEALNKALEEKINSGENKFIISAEAKFNLNKNQKDLVNYELNFNKHEATGNYYLNSYKTTVELHNNQKHSQNFFLGRGIDFTAKEAYNLLSGRGVKKTANINSYSLALFADDKLIQKSPNLLRLEKDILPRAIKEHNAQKYAIVVMNENEKAVIKNFDNKGKETPLHRTGKLELSQKFVRENDKSFDIIPFPVNNMNEAKKALIEILTNKKIDSVTLKENGLPIQTFNKNGKEIQLDLNAKQENVWIKLNFSQKDNYNNYPLNTYYQNWGYNLKEILNKLPIQEIQDPIKRDYIIASLEKGNAQPVNIPLKNGDMHALIAYADPQFKKIGLLYQDSLRPVYENNNKNVNQIQIKEELAKENPLKENPVQEQIPKQKR